MTIPGRAMIDGCAAVPSALDEPALATAPEPATNWLLVEHRIRAQEVLPLDIESGAFEYFTHNAAARRNAATADSTP